MKALSIRQPWAWLIVHGYKDVENRTWPLPEDMRGQRIYVHAGVKVEWEADTTYIVDRLKPNMEHVAAFMDTWGRCRMPTGAIVGEATVVREARPEESHWYEGPHGFLLRDAVVYDKPIPWRGQLRFFEVKDARPGSD